MNLSATLYHCFVSPEDHSSQTVAHHLLHYLDCMFTGNAGIALAVSMYFSPSQLMEKEATIKQGLMIVWLGKKQQYVIHIPYITLHNFLNSFYYFGNHR